MLSVIIPTYNESKNPFLLKTLEQLDAYKGCEVLCVDSQSLDGTSELLARFDSVSLISTAKKSRAARLSEGINRAKHDMILLHHPRSHLEPKALELLIARSQELIWGGFQHRFDHEHWLLDFTSWYSNRVRLPLRKIVYLDHCLFFHRNLLPTGSPFEIPDVDIFEDTLISKVLSQAGKPLLLPAFSTTSSLRFKKNGIVRQCLMNAVLKGGYLLNIDHRLMNKVYEKGLSLNTSYKPKGE